jgi:thiol-disulfide isomerase/thioredoxin
MNPEGNWYSWCTDCRAVIRQELPTYDSAHESAVNHVKGRNHFVYVISERDPDRFDCVVGNPELPIFGNSEE